MTYKLQDTQVPFNAYHNDHEDGSFCASSRMIASDLKLKGAGSGSGDDRPPKARAVRRFFTSCFPKLRDRTKSKPPAVSTSTSTQKQTIQHAAEQKNMHVRNHSGSCAAEESLIQSYMDSIHFEVEQWALEDGDCPCDTDNYSYVSGQDQGRQLNLSPLNSAEMDDYFSLCPAESDLNSIYTYNGSNLENTIHSRKRRNSRGTSSSNDDSSFDHPWVPFESLSFCNTSASKSRSSASNSSQSHRTPPRTPSKEKLSYKPDAFLNGLGTPSTEATGQSFPLNDSMNSSQDEEIGALSSSFDDMRDDLLISTSLDAEDMDMLVVTKTVSDLDHDLELPSFEDKSDGDDGCVDHFDLMCGGATSTFSGSQSNGGKLIDGSGRGTDRSSHSDNDSDLSDDESKDTTLSKSTAVDDHTKKMMKMDNSSSTHQNKDAALSSNPKPEQNAAKVGEQLAHYMSIFYPNECSYGPQDKDEESDDEGDSCCSSFVDQGSSRMQSLDDLHSKDVDFDTLYKINSGCSI